MPPSDNELLDFDASGLGMADAGDARRLLHEHGDVFRAQLVAARRLDELRRNVVNDGMTGTVREASGYYEGFDRALREAVAHLRQGDFLPGGQLYEDDAPVDGD